MPTKKTFDPCGNCAMCCKYISIILKKPKNSHDIDNIYWYLLHEGITVCILEKNIWVIKIDTKCKNLAGSGLCKNYSSRPDVCRDYSFEQCERYGDEHILHIFKNVGEFFSYIKRDKKLFTLVKEKEEYKENFAKWQNSL